LHIAASSGHFEFVKELVRKLNDETSRENMGKSALKMGEKHPEIVIFLQENGGIVYVEETDEFETTTMMSSTKTTMMRKRKTLIK